MVIVDRQGNPCAYKEISATGRTLCRLERVPAPDDPDSEKAIYTNVGRMHPLCRRLMSYKKPGFPTSVNWECTANGVSEAKACKAGVEQELIRLGKRQMHG